MEISLLLEKLKKLGKKMRRDREERQRQFTDIFEEIEREYPNDNASE